MFLAPFESVKEKKEASGFIFFDLFLTLKLLRQ